MCQKIDYQSDLIFFIGIHTGGQVTHNWRVPPMGVDVIQLDINPSELGRSYPIKPGMQAESILLQMKLREHTILQ